MEHHGKILSLPRGDLNPRRLCQSTDMQGTRPSHTPKNDAWTNGRDSVAQLNWLEE